MYFKGTLYLNALDEISHREIVVEENAHQHLHHFAIELKWEMGRQDQLETEHTQKDLLPETRKKHQQIAIHLV